MPNKNLNKNKTAKNKNAPKIARLQGRKKRSSAAMIMSKSVGLSAKAEYRRMLFDPCASDLVEPPYLGSESGYLIRTRDVVTPYASGSSLVAGNFDFIVQWSPGNLGPTAATTNLGIMIGGASTLNANMTLVAGAKSATQNQENFINSSSTPVSSYRVVACCLKFIPTGPPLSRQGMVAMCNFPSFFTTAAGTPSFGDIETICPHPVNNGSEAHEIVWLPGSADQQYGALEASVLDPGYGTLVCALGGVDSSVNSAATRVSPNGRFEITTIWQWTAKATGGVVQTVNAPPKHTVNDVLAEVVDLGKKIYTGARKVETGVMGVAHLLAKVL